MEHLYSGRQSSRHRRFRRCSWVGGEAWQPGRLANSTSRTAMAATITVRSFQMRLPASFLASPPSKRGNGRRLRHPPHFPSPSPWDPGNAEARTRGPSPCSSSAEGLPSGPPSLWDLHTSVELVWLTVLLHGVPPCPRLSAPASKRGGVGVVYGIATCPGGPDTMHRGGRAL